MNYVKQVDSFVVTGRVSLFVKLNACCIVYNFDYDLNVDAALYFSTEIFSIILKQVPKVRLFLVGNSPPTEIRRLAFPKYRHTEVTGYVNSLDPFYEASTVVVCPLRIGGGVKVKLLEAIRAGKAIVTIQLEHRV